jgi:hypothetical protein
LTYFLTATRYTDANGKACFKDGVAVPIPGLTAQELRDLADMYGKLHGYIPTHLVIEVDLNAPTD